ncbi:MAG: hypothetical protein C6Y20_10220 [Tagaea sp. CACIAM 22H2]|nr:hypothetical protein [Tagaea sp. CACIAM 22H2]
MSQALWAICSIGWRTTDKGGVVSSAQSGSSKATTDRSLGIFTPSDDSVSSSASAIVEFDATIVSGRLSPASNARIWSAKIASSGSRTSVCAAIPAFAPSRAKAAMRWRVVTSSGQRTTKRTSRRPRAASA